MSIAGSWLPYPYNPFTPVNLLGYNSSTTALKWSDGVLRQGTFVIWNRGELGRSWVYRNRLQRSREDFTVEEAAGVIVWLVTLVISALAYPEPASSRVHTPDQIPVKRLWEVFWRPVEAVSTDRVAIVPRRWTYYCFRCPGAWRVLGAYSITTMTPSCALRSVFGDSKFHHFKSRDPAT